MLIDYSILFLFLDLNSISVFQIGESHHFLLQPIFFCSDAANIAECFPVTQALSRGHSISCGRASL